MSDAVRKLIEEFRPLLPAEDTRLLAALPADVATAITSLEHVVMASLRDDAAKLADNPVRVENPSGTTQLPLETLHQENRRAALAAVLLYRLYEHPLESTRARTTGGFINNETGAYLYAMFRELLGWEPVTNLDLALVVKTDRAVIRSARVAATHVDPEAFMTWLLNNHRRLERGVAHWEALSHWLDRMPGSTTDENQLREREKEFHQIARRCLRDYGIMHGRLGLQNLRTQLGASRAKTNENETRFSEDVVLLAGHFIKLSPAERKAFRVLAGRLEAAEASSPQSKKHVTE